MGDDRMRGIDWREWEEERRDEKLHEDNRQKRKGKKMNGS